MENEAIVFTPHELRVARDEAMELTSKEAREKRARVSRILRRIYRQTPRLSVDRGQVLHRVLPGNRGTTPGAALGSGHRPGSWKRFPCTSRKTSSLWAAEGPLAAMASFTPSWRALTSPRTSGSWSRRKAARMCLPPRTFRPSKTTSYPTGRARLSVKHLALCCPTTLKTCFTRTGTSTCPRSSSPQTATVRHSIQWSLDYKKILERGFDDIKREAEERLASLDVWNPADNLDKTPYYKAVIVICDAMKAFAHRHAELARDLALKEDDQTRRRELLEIAEICKRVPAKPAQTFHEAVQAQWFSQLASRFEQVHGGVIGNGRIDQYLYPYYKKDLEEGRLTRDQAQELLECLWLNMAQFLRLQPTAAGYLIYEGNAHWEHTTIGGVKPDGSDASNELTYLILQSKKEFPLDYPDLGVRIHSQTPESLLMTVADLIKEGTGFPKLMNDEEIIPIFLAKGAKLEEARDYVGSGCTEVRLLNRNTYFTGTTWLNLGAVLEMALYDGRCTAGGDKRLGLPTGDPTTFTSFDQMWDAFEKQLRNAQEQVFRQQYITDYIRPGKVAAPLLSSLHQLCMEQGKDVNVGNLEGGLNLGGQTGPVGFGTVIDSLEAIRKLVFEDKTVTMAELIEALGNDFKGNEVLRQKCLNMPSYGNRDDTVDELGRQIESILVGMCDEHVNYYGGKPEIFYVPVTSHVAMGRVTGATPNGRKAGVALSEGISPSQGADIMGPTTTLHSIAYTKNTPYVQRAARLLNIKVSPQTVAGDEGTRKLASFIRTWCDQKHWHLQFNIINRATLLAAQTDPEKYRNLLVRVAGYSAYFVDLSPALQNEIISRTEHSDM